MTSTWIRSAPAFSTALISSPSRLKSADRMDGAICFFIRVSFMLYLLAMIRRPIFTLTPASRSRRGTTQAKGLAMPVFLISQDERRIHAAPCRTPGDGASAPGLFGLPREEDEPVGDLLGRYGPPFQGARSGDPPGSGCWTSDPSVPCVPPMTAPVAASRQRPLSWRHPLRACPLDNADGRADDAACHCAQGAVLDCTGATSPNSVFFAMRS